jgi:hypothetical protein
VQRPDDNRGAPQPPHHYSPEVQEHAVYLAVGDLPDVQQLQATGWWDAGRRRGVTELTRCFDWGSWFPTYYLNVLHALDVARATEFESGIPSARQHEEEVRDIPEMERNDLKNDRGDASSSASNDGDNPDC